MAANLSRSFAQGKGATAAVALLVLLPPLQRRCLFAFLIWPLLLATKHVLFFLNLFVVRSPAPPVPFCQGSSYVAAHAVLPPVRAARQRVGGSGGFQGRRRVRRGAVLFDHGHDGSEPRRPRGRCGRLAAGLVMLSVAAAVVVVVLAAAAAAARCFVWVYRQLSM